MAAEERKKYKKNPWQYLGHLEDKANRQATRNTLRDERLKCIGHPDFDPVPELFPIIPAWIDADLA